MSLTLILAQDYLTWKHANIVLSGQIDLSINGSAARARMLRIAYILGSMVLLGGCAEHRGSSVAYVSQPSPGRYEARLVSVQVVAGGPCNFPQWPHREYVTYRSEEHTSELQSLRHL